MNRALRTQRALGRAVERQQAFVRTLDAETVCRLLRAEYQREREATGAHDFHCAIVDCGFAWLLEDNWRETFVTLSWRQPYGR